MTTAVHTWWIVLRIVAALNIAAWITSAAVLARRRDRYLAVEHQRRRWLLWLSGAYVAGCAFRSFLPRIDLVRVCLLDSELSSMVVGRSVATVVELCFIAQCALLLHYTGRHTGNKFTVIVSLLLVPLIVVAECASWYAILSTNYFGHVLENSIWTFCAALLLTSFVLLWPRIGRRQRSFLVTMMVFAIGYIAFMTTVDVPMYWARWNAELMAGVNYLSLTQGWIDASRHCVESFDWSVWREEIPWMTLYFTVAVWLSISLPHAPAWLYRSPGDASTKIRRRFAGN